MLVIGRKRHERVVITAGPHRIVVELCSICHHDGSVDLGFSADRSVVIDREEVARAKGLEIPAREDETPARATD